MNVYLILILSILILEYIIDSYANYLNINNINKNLPDDFEDVYDKKKYKQSQNYNKDKLFFSSISQTISLIGIILFILIGGFNYIDIIARSISDSNLISGVIFIDILIILIGMFSIPFSYYNTFVIEEKYNFNNTTHKTFIFDFLKSLMVSLIIVSVVFALLIWFFDKTNNYGWIYSWIAVTLFLMIVQYIAPRFLLPLFNNFYPIEDDKLKEKIDNLFENFGYNIKGIFTMDGSRRTSKMNAFFVGFGKNKRIVLYDTLKEKMKNEEIVTVLAHELGHFRKKHILKNIIISIINFGILLFILSYFIKNQQLFEAFKMDHLSIYASFVFFGFLYSPVTNLLSLIQNKISRKHEYEADEFAVKTTKEKYEFISALKKLSVNNYTNLEPHPFYVFINYDHPPVLKRVKNIKNL